MDPYVDVLYRGLEVAKRVRLADFQRGTGYLEVPAPMPAGTEIEVVTDGGVRFTAVVRSIHEQVGGATQAPGMRIAPRLADTDAQTWWQQQTEFVPSQRSKTAVLGTDEVAATVKAAELAERGIATEIGSSPDRETRQLSSAEVQSAMLAAETLSSPPRMAMARATAPRYQLDTDTIVNPPSRYQLDADTIVNPDLPADADGYVDDGRSTQAMDVIDREVLEQLAAEGAIVEPVEDDAGSSGMFTTGLRTGSVTAPIVNEASGELTAGGKKAKRNKKR